MLVTLIVVAIALAVLAIGCTVVLVANAREWRRFVREHDEAAARYEADMAAWRRRAAQTPEGERVPAFPGRPAILCGSWARRLAERWSRQSRSRPPTT